MPKVTRKETAGPLRATHDPPMEEDNAASTSTVPKFAPISAFEANGKRIEFRRVPVPTHRMTALKTNWLALYKPVTETLKLDMRMNLKSRKVEIKATPATTEIANLQRAADFVHAFVLGFEPADAIALLRLDDLYLESFEVKDVKTLRGEHLARCIGRLAGKGGKTKYTIENASRTRITLADTKIHILGSSANIRAARDALCALILGSPASKVTTKLRTVASRLAEAY